MSEQVTTPAQPDWAEAEQAELLAAVEAVLVVADAPVSDEALAQALGLSPARARRLVEQLAAEYEGGAPQPPGPDPARQEDAQAEGPVSAVVARPRGLVLRRAAGGWRLASAPRFDELVRRFVIGGATTRLSQAALETLAVIAYRQPVTRGRVAAVRGVNVDSVIRTLHARGLVEEAGTEPSGAVLYRTTDQFLEYVGIDSLEDLPALAPYLPQASELDELDAEAAGRHL